MSDCITLRSIPFIDKVDGVLLRDHVLPLAEKLSGVANKRIAINVKCAYMDRIKEAIGINNEIYRIEQ